MPNFPPLRRYVFSVVDRWIERHGLEPPFLDVGCGTGALAAHLAEHGWEGVALETSPEAARRARERLAGHPGVSVVAGDLAGMPRDGFGTVFIMDVLEHVRDDEELLAALAARLRPGGALVLLVPVNPAEWRHDDELYGHCRRYGWDEIMAKLARAGLAVEADWNVTVPVMWGMRRFYLACLPSRPTAADPGALTAASSFYNPWDRSGILRVLGQLAAAAVWWRPLFRLQDRFAASRRGHAAMFLARRAAA